MRLTKKSYSITATHTGSNTHTPYVLNHNLGTKDVGVKVGYTSTNSGYTNMEGYVYDSSNNYGVDVVECTLNQCTARVYKFLVGNTTATLPIKITVYAF